MNRSRIPISSGAKSASSSIGSRSGIACRLGSPPFAKWFVDGKINVSYNCLDRHLTPAAQQGGASIWEGEPGEPHAHLSGAAP